MGLMRSALLWASQNQWIKQTLPRYRFVRRAVTRFMPGEEASDALAAAEELRNDNLATVLTKLGENITSAEEAERVAAHYREVLDSIKKRKLDCHVSVKLTQLGLDLGADICLRNLRSILHHAQELANFVWVDIESSSYVDATIEIFKRARKDYTNVGLCLQAYLYRTVKDLDGLLAIPSAIRLVKGAYAEPERIAYHRKEDVDKNFLELAQRILDAARDGRQPSGIGTHDRRIIGSVRDSLETLKLSKNAVEFQLLYGIQREEQLRLAREGYKTRVLISYGSYWFPWYMRRLAERPANVWFVLKNIFAK
jgi:proline dehydrogenase